MHKYIFRILIAAICSVLLGLPLLARGSSSKADSDALLISETEAGIFNKTGYPIVKTPITLSGIFSAHPLNGNLDQMPVVQRIQEKAGIELDIQQLPGDAYSQKIDLLFASGDVPDIVLSWGPSGVLNYAEMLRPVEPYIDNHMPNMLAVLKQRPQFRAQLRLADGNIYNLITVGEHPQYQTPGNLFINKKWLDALGLPIPKTTEEFYQTLKAFKTQDPNGNGKNDEIPISLTGGGWWPWQELHTLVGSFTFPFDNRYRRLNAKGKIEFVPVAEAEGFQNFVEWWQKIYQEGLADIETYTQSESIIAAKAQEGIIGAFTAWFDENILGDGNTGDFVMVKPLKGPGKKPQWTRDGRQMLRPFLLPRSNPYPASTMRLMDLGYEPDWAWQIVYGPWDIVLKKNADGSIATIPGPDGVSESQWRHLNTPGGGWPSALLSNQLVNWIGPKNHQRKAKRHEMLKPYLPSLEEYPPEVSMTMEENNEASVLSTDIEDFFIQQYVNWVTQGTNVREAWPDFVAQLKRIGLDRYMELHQIAYDRAMSQ